MSIIQTLWIGNKLDSLHVDALKSFIKYHEVHLYCYENIENVPLGIVLKDGNSIINEKEIFYCQTEPGKGSPSPFSDLFRWKLLYELGGWWVDTDMVCVKPWDFTNDIVLASEISMVKSLNYSKGVQFATCACKFPVGHIVPKECYEYCLTLKKEEITWCQTGIDILNEKALKHGLKYEDVDVFCPLQWWDWDKEVFLSEKTYGIHRYYEMHRRNKRI